MTLRSGKKQSRTLIVLIVSSMAVFAAVVRWL